MKPYFWENVEYVFNRNSRKWQFRFGSNTLLIEVPGGKEVALAIAKQISASCKRSKHSKLDGLARKNITNLTKVSYEQEE